MKRLLTLDWLTPDRMATGLLLAWMLMQVAGWIIGEKADPARGAETLALACLFLLRAMREDALAERLAPRIDAILARRATR